jgi:hypothetical protein
MELRAAGVSDLRFSTADARLRDAARVEGFEPA